jgi:hypothetical protein
VQEVPKLVGAHNLFIAVVIGIEVEPLMRVVLLWLLPPPGLLRLGQLPPLLLLFPLLFPLLLPLLLSLLLSLLLLLLLLQQFSTLVLLLSLPPAG